MNWNAIGAIGSILGALAVAATLVYLSVQVKQTQRIAKLQASQNLNDMFNQSFALVATSPELARHVFRLERVDDLSDEDFVQYVAKIRSTQ